MARKNTHLHKMLDSVSKSEALDLASNFITDVTNVQNLDNIGIQFVWTGLGLSGEIFVESSNDHDPIRQTGNWAELDFGMPVVVASNSGDHLISINQIPFAWIRVRYAATAGTGTATSISLIKQAGG